MNQPQKEASGHTSPDSVGLGKTPDQVGGRLWRNSIGEPTGCQAGTPDSTFVGPR